jgi:hypothetical protein
MSEENQAKTAIPVLTDVVTDKDEIGLSDPTPNVDKASLIAELQTQLAANAYALTEQVLHTAFAEMEATLFEQVSKRLRQELPELVDRILREHLGDESEES